MACTDCSNPDSKIALECKKHVICTACLIIRGESCHLNVMKCGECVKKKESTPPPLSYRDVVVHQEPAIIQEEQKAAAEASTQEPLPGIWIFVDDSNIWIEAKKLQSEKRHLKTKEDHRVRIDVGKLADAVADGRPIKKGLLYGSEPPPVDTVWEKIEKIENFSVRKNKRSQLTGKEKQVDTELVADITEIAIKTPEHERTTIILISGDADVIPGLEKILKENRWSVEIYMWRQAIAGSLRRFTAEHKERVKIKELDNYIDKITFTSMKFNISKKDKFLLQKVKEGGIVFTMENKAFKNRIPSYSWCNQLESLTQWPFQYYWFELRGQKTDHLVIVFRENEGKKPDLTEFLKIIRNVDYCDAGKKYCLPCLQNVQTFLTFSDTTFKKDLHERLSDIALEVVGAYSEEDVHQDFDSIQPKHMKQYRLYSEHCRYKLNCRYGIKCNKQHSDDEKAYFRQRPNGKGNPWRKTNQCNQFSEGKCRHKDAHHCDYAHGKEDAWCLGCTSYGHFTANCPDKEK